MDSKFKKRLICRMVPMMAAQKIKWPAPGSEEAERSQFAVQRAAATWYNEKNKVLIIINYYIHYYKLYNYYFVALMLMYHYY